MSSDGPFSGKSMAPEWESIENPQAYSMTQFAYTSPEPRRHELGLVGGNNVSQIAGNMIDLESDLRGITRPLTFAPWKKYQPPQPAEKTIERNNVKQQLVIDKTLVHQPVYQMWAYPAAYAPTPLKTEVCASPQKY
jgi:hypothetical protein